MNADWKVPGDNLITQDTVSGLEWLDWTQSVQRTYDDVITQFGVGGDFAGFRHATAAEANAFFLSSGGAGGPLTGTSITTGLNFVGFLGQTFPAFSFGIIEQVTTAGTHDILEVSSTTVSLFTPPKADSASVSSLGHALVRSIPEPSTAVLLACGLAGLAAPRRRIQVRPAAAPASRRDARLLRAGTPRRTATGSFAETRP